MAAIWSVLFAEARQHYRRWLTLVILIGLFGGVLITTVVGARRTESAYSRLVASKFGAQYMIDEFIPNPEAATIDPHAVAALPAIAEANAFRVYSTTDNTRFNLVASANGKAFGTGLSQPKVVAGRLADANDASEVVVDFTLPNTKVGDSITVHLQRSVAGDPHRPAPPSVSSVAVTLRVVGIVATPTGFPPFANNSYFTGSNCYLTPAFYRAHGDSLAALEYSLVRVRPGRASAANRQVTLLGHGKPVGVQDLTAQATDVERSTHLTATALWLLAALLLAAGLLVFGQLLARTIALEADEYPTLRSIGMTQHQLVALALARTATVGMAGAVLAIVIAISLSPLMPIGLARTAEPAPGVNLDVTILLMASAGIVGVLVLVSLWPSWREAVRASRAGRVEVDVERGWLSAITGAGARAGLPITATLGLRMALLRGRGSTSVPTWSTIGAAAVGLAALVASLTFGASLNCLIGTPPLYGVTWDTEIWNSNGPEAIPAATPVVRADAAVASAAFIQTGLDVRLGGHSVPGFAFEPVKGRFGVAMLSGRPPTGNDEVALGARTASFLRSDLGTTLRGSAENPAAPAVPVRVVGTVVLPPGDISAHLGDGVIVTRTGLLRLAGGSARSPYVIAVTFRAGVNQTEATSDLERRLRSVDTGFFTQSPATPADLVNFGRIQNLPFLLGSILATFALLTLAHLVITSVRRRGRDVAVMKVMGFDRADVRNTVAWQASTLGVLAVAIGIPVGVIVGRVSWRLFAEQLGVTPEVIIPALAVALIVPAALVLTNAVALLPAIGASRTPTTVVLREE